MGSLCLNEKRQVWSFGNGEKGQLGHGDKNEQKLPKKIAYFEENNVEIGSIYANYYKSAAISVDKNDLYIWGNDKCLPEKMDLFNDSKILSVGLGPSLFGFLCESKEEFKE